jgi:hypothetical protein
VAEEVLHIVKKALAELKRHRLRRIYREGQVVSRFIARDVRRDVLVVAAEELDSGIITARVRTTNILYECSSLVEKSSFGAPERISLDRLWHWSGASWGGLPDGTSIVTKLGQSTDRAE